MPTRLRSDEQRMVYQLKAQCLFGLGRDVEARHYQRKVRELQQDERAASSRSSQELH
jgi:hypothetical protein